VEGNGVAGTVDQRAGGDALRGARTDVPVSGLVICLSAGGGINNFSSKMAESSSSEDPAQPTEIDAAQGGEDADEDVFDRFATCQRVNGRFVSPFGSVRSPCH
jgi:hypothetical protein